MAVERVAGLEARLQNVLNEGGQVWAVGDVHGFSEHLELLLERIQPSPTTEVVLLGDLIDRGPASHEVVTLAREHPYIHAIKGNHEAVFVQAIAANQMGGDGSSKHSKIYRDWSAIYGGNCTEKGYKMMWGDHAEVKMFEDAMWLNTLPEIIILDRWILCHAGIDPSKEINEQSGDDLLWTRHFFDETHGIYDPMRTVVHGHMVTGKLDDGRWGEPHVSNLRLPDGRHARIDIDTSAYSKSSGILTAIKLDMNPEPHFINSEGQ